MTLKRGNLSQEHQKPIFNFHKLVDKKILVLDGCKDIGFSLKIILEDICPSVSVMVMTKSLHIRELVDKECFDLIIVDDYLYPIGGFGISVSNRDYTTASQRPINIPVIITQSSIYSATKKKRPENNRLQKPFDLNKLFKIVLSNLESD